MTTPLTRRELRDLERAGALSEPSSSTPIQQQVESKILIPAQSPFVASMSPDQIEVQSRPLTRRQMREQGLLDPMAQSETPKILDETNLESPPLETLTSLPLPSRRSLRDSSVTDLEDHALTPLEDRALPSVEDGSRLSAIEAPEEQLFIGSNLFAEPSTQSIILEVVTEAISLPMDTGEIFTTGSISIVSDPTTGAHTAGFDLDGISQDRESVLGLVSTVSPISALDLIDQRASIGVVPQSVLRKGWWKPWALAAGALVLAITAILASITILGAIGG